MIDYISTTTQLFDCKGTHILPHLGNPDAVYSSGWSKYHLQGCERLAVWVHPNLGMRLEGSISYYWQGNNFSFSNSSFVEAICHINGLLGVDLWKSVLNVFEYGVIMQVKMKPKEYIQHHKDIKKEGLLMNEKPQDRGTFRWWKDGNVSLKMYDAKKNILMKQGEDRRQVIRNSGWEDAGEFLKWECHYIRPECLNKGVGLRLHQLVNSNWDKIIKEDVYLQYKRLLPMKSIIIPENKKDLSTADILALTYAEESINEGRTLDELRKVLYSRINAIPDDVLTKSDKDARKRQVKTLLDKLQESPESKWDLSEKIQEALEAG